MTVVIHPVELHATLPTTTSLNDATLNMRKRKRGHGTYVDEDTGEKTVVQTTKEAKRQHQKHGKWYKEPTSQEIRAWDREEERQKAAHKNARREQNRKINAEKRAKAEAKEQALKKELFDTGKITFTQTLAKKDASQLNLHSWFGGRPKQLVTKEAIVKDIKNDGGRAGCRTIDKDKESGMNGDQQFRANVQLKQNDQDSWEQRSAESVNPDQFGSGSQHSMDRPLIQQDEFDLLLSSQDFEIAEDQLVAVEAAQDVEQDSLPQFRVPALPEHTDRLPLSPMSESDLNVRTADTLQVSSFKDRLQETGMITLGGTQAVRQLLGGISTQDLVENLEDDIFDDKENIEPAQSSPELPQSPTKLKASSPLKAVEYVEKAPSFADSLDSFEYDDLFNDLNHEAKNSEDDFGDDMLDDAAMLALVESTTTARNVLQMDTSHTTQTTIPVQRTGQGTDPVQTTIQAQTSVSLSKTKSPPQQSKRRSPLLKSDTFALEGVEEADMLEQLEQYEREQKATAVTSNRISSRLRIHQQDGKAFIRAEQNRTSR